MYLTQALHRSTRMHPEAQATVFGERVQTFAQLTERVARLAGALREIGVKPGDRVGILALNSDRYLESLFAIPWAGGAVNPVNVRWNPSEIAYSLDDSGTEVLLLDDTFAKLIPTLRERSPALATIVHIGEDPTPEGALSYQELVSGADAIEDALRGGDDLAGVFYTGGTTGFPKGVMLSHKNLVTAGLSGLASGNFFRGSARPRALHVAPMFHLADLAFLVMTSIHGGTNVILPGFEPQKTLDAISRHSVTDLLLVPTMIQMLTAHPGLDQADLSTLESILYGASPISEALLAQVRAKLPAVGLVQAYGMTELAAVGTVLSSADHDNPVRRRSGGRPAPTTEIRILDSDDVEQPPGTVGEIVVRGSAVMQGYWGKPELTEQTLRGGWMHTGDAGYVDEDGYVYVVDRLKDMIISGGENVYSAEVENAVSSHESVAACAVIGVPDDRWGERVHAVVVLAPGADVTEDDVIEHARRTIAGYKCPRSVSFTDMLPVSAAGKILKVELRRRHTSPSIAGRTSR